MSNMRVLAVGPEDANDLVRPELWTNDSGSVWAVAREKNARRSYWATESLVPEDYTDPVTGEVSWKRVWGCLDNMSSDVALDMAEWLDTQ